MDIFIHSPMDDVTQPGTSIICVSTHISKSNQDFPCPSGEENCVSKKKNMAQEPPRPHLPPIGGSGGEGSSNRKMAKLVKEMESISFKDAQINPALLDPYSLRTQSLPSSTTAKRRTRSKKESTSDPDKTKKKNIRSSQNSESGKTEAAKEDLGEKISRRVRRSEKFSKGKKSLLTKEETMSTVTTLKTKTSPTAPHSTIVNGKGTSSSLPQRPSKTAHLNGSIHSDSKVKLNETTNGMVQTNGNSEPPLGPRAMLEATQDSSKVNEENAKILNSAEVKIKNLEKARKAKVQEEENRKKLIRENEDAIAHKVVLQTMEENWKFDQQIGHEWCEGIVRQPNEHQKDFRHRCVGNQIQMLWHSTRPSEEILQMRSEVIKEVEAILDRRWSGCNLRVAPFGSTATGLVEATSDIDLCLLDPTRPNGVGTPENEVLPLPKYAQFSTLHSHRVIGVKGVPDYYSVRYIARALEKDRVSFNEVQPIEHANVPIVKFVHSRSGLAGDLNVNDSFGLRNSELICRYIDVCPHIVAPFVFCIKKWAARRRINDPSGKSGIFSLNSYTICLIALQYLQVQGIIPNLQSPTLLKTLNVERDLIWQRPKGKARKLFDDMNEDENNQTKIFVDPVSGGRLFNTTFCSLTNEEEHRLAEEDAKENRTGFCKPYSRKNSYGSTEMEQQKMLGNLFEGFFQWLSNFDFERCGISLREGHPFRRHSGLLSNGDDEHFAEFPYVVPLDRKWEDDSFICQDPFIIDRNTSGAVIKTVRMMIVQEARRAFMILTRDEEGMSGKDELKEVQMNSTKLSELMLDCEYEQLSEFHQKMTSEWTNERVQYIQTESKARSKKPRYLPQYRKVHDKRLIEAKAELAKEEKKESQRKKALAKKVKEKQQQLQQQLQQDQQPISQ